MVWIVLGVFLVGGLPLLVLVAGNRLPKEYNVARMAYFNRSPGEIWLIISDFAGQTSWRPDLRSVDRLPPRNGRDVWRETDSRGQVTTLITVERLPQRRLARRIADEDLPFGGGWAIEIGQFGEVTSLTVTETGEIENPLFRFMSRYIIGHASAADRYLTALGKKLGVDVTIMSG
jgi:hypothetical protein